MVFDFTRIGDTPTAPGMFIGGVWQERAGGSAIEVENPANESVVATIPDGTADHAEQALSEAKAAQSAWAARPAIERGNCVSALANEIATHKQQLARLVYP